MIRREGPPQALPNMTQPDVSPNPANALLQGLQASSESLIKTAHALEQKLKHTEQQADIHFAQAGFEQDISNREIELLRKNNGANPNYKSELDHYTREIAQSYIGNFEDPVVKNKLKEIFNTRHAALMSRGNQIEHQARLGHAQNKTEATLDTLINTALSHPDTFAQMRAQGLSLIHENQIFDSNQKEQIAQNFTRKLRDANISGRINLDAQSMLISLDNGDYDKELKPQQIQHLQAQARQKIASTQNDNNAGFDYLIDQGAPTEEIVDGLERALNENLITLPAYYKRLNQLHHRDMMNQKRVASIESINEKIRLGLPRQVDETPANLNNWYQAQLQSNSDQSIERKTGLMAILNAPASSYTAEMEFALTHAPVTEGSAWGQAFKTLDKNGSAALDNLDQDTKQLARDMVLNHEQAHMSWTDALQLARDDRNPLDENIRKQRAAEFDALDDWKTDINHEKNLNKTVANIIGATKWLGLRHDADKIPEGEKRTIREAAKKLYTNKRITNDRLKEQMQLEFSRNYGTGYNGQFMKYPQSVFDPDLSLAAQNNALSNALYQLADLSQTTEGAYVQYKNPDYARFIDLTNPKFNTHDFNYGKKPRLIADNELVDINITSDAITPEGRDGRPSYMASYYDKRGVFHFVLDPQTGLPWRYVPLGFDKLVAPYLPMPRNLSQSERDAARAQLQQLRREAQHD